MLMDRMTICTDSKSNVLIRRGVGSRFTNGRTLTAGKEEEYVIEMWSDSLYQVRKPTWLKREYKPRWIPGDSFDFETFAAIFESAARVQYFQYFQSFVFCQYAHKTISILILQDILEAMISSAGLYVIARKVPALSDVRELPRIWASAISEPTVVDTPTASM